MSTGSNTQIAATAGGPTANPAEKDDVLALAKKWKKKPGTLIMALHDLQSRLGFVPRESAMKLGHAMGVPLATIYEVITFYNYFKLDSPGRHIISVCTGTACHIKGGSRLVLGLEKDLNIKEGQSTPDKEYHLQAVRCLGCCGLAPVASVNGKVYGKLDTSDAHGLIERIRIDQPVAATQPEVAAE